MWVARALAETAGIRDKEKDMRFESTVTSISWIPSEAISGPMRLPIDMGVGHYDQPPPDTIEDATLDELLAKDRYRFANRLGAWIEVEDGEIVDAGYSGRALVGSTTAGIGPAKVTFPGVAFPLIREDPVIEGDTARFVQTAGGRTGSPLPRRIDRPPYVRIVGPPAWTTLALEINADGTAAFEVAGASPFPRHWIYDDTGSLAAKSGIVDWSTWTREHDEDRSPWNDMDRDALMSDVESGIERELSHSVMKAKPDIRSFAKGAELTIQGEPGDDLFLVLDGLMEVDVDGAIVAEIGPGAIVGERALIEGGRRTSTVRAITPVKVAAVSSDAIELDALTEVAAGHRREDG